MSFSIDARLEVPNELNGIISKIKNVYKINPINDEYVIPSSSGGDVGNVNTVVLWDNYLHQTCVLSNAIAWIQLSFPKGYIYPNAYSMRGTYEENNGRYFPLSWIIYGIYEGDIGNQNKWVKLGENNVSESTYCNNVLNGNTCQDKRVGTFVLNKPIPTRGYKYMRWVLKTSCVAAYNCFAASGIDIYGILSNSSILYRKRLTCRCSNNRSSFIFVVLCSLVI